MEDFQKEFEKLMDELYLSAAGGMPGILRWEEIAAMLEKNGLKIIEDKTVPYGTQQ